MPTHNPSHPGHILKLSLGEMDVTEAARRLDVARPTLSKILNSRSGISVEMAERLAKFFGNSSTFWMNLQTNFDIAQVRKKKGYVASLKKVIPYGRIDEAKTARTAKELRAY